MARGYAAGFGDPREKGNLGKSTRRSLGLSRFTLHDASLGGHMHAAAHNVNLWPEGAGKREAIAAPT